jgi:hypothetical protein
MTSICVPTQENGSISACTNVDLDENGEGNVSVLLIATHPDKGHFRLTISRETGLALGEALVEISRALKGYR